jgi:hypothetical protein
MTCVVVLLLGCADSGSAVVDTATAIAGAVRIEADGCGPRTRIGTGTAIDDGLVVTAAHVVAGSDSVKVIGDDGHTVSAEVVSFDPDLDVAAVRPVTPVATPVDLRSTPVGADDVGVVVVADIDGAMEAIPVDVIRRVTIRTTDIYLDADVERAGFEFEGSIEPGDSGAMVHFVGGAAGVVWARSTVDADRAWAVTLPDQLIDSTSRRSLLDEVDTGPCS